MKVLKTVFIAGSLALASFCSQAELISNGSFENSPSTLNAANYIYLNGEYAGWLFASGSGVLNATGPSAWYGINSPSGFDGNNYAFIQGLGVIEQSFDLAEDSMITLDWTHTGRPSGGVGGLQTYQVKIDGVERGLYSTESNYTFSANSLSGIVLAAGEHSIEFVGTITTDSTAFIDAISLAGEVIAPVPVPASIGLFALSMIGFSFRRKGK